ncbi:MAG: DegT/DnrJ/EryC1/StrS family aminotransferase [Planctomycetes bacterium]|nr:DegT/DnrJ/EryC1/StrS family aminotransferase [Planctomycetota bacterium]
MIPFVDLKAQHRALKQELLEAAARVLDSCQFALGNEVTAFEEEFAAYCTAKYCAGVNTGTSALHLALLAADIGPGDEVITVPHTFIATVSSILYAGAKPVFVDIDPVSYTMDPSRIEAAITPRTKAIMPVHLYGQTADMDPILEIARKHKLLVVEDACQAHGAEYKGRRAGTLGHMAAFSFYPGKNLGACGEGGALVTNDETFIRKVRMLRDWGQEKRYHHTVLGYNYRMDNMQGAFLRIKLRHLPAWTEARRQHAKVYRELLTGSDVVLPTEMAYAKHVYHLYAVLTTRRDELQKKLTDSGASSGLHYPLPIHLQPCVANLGYKAGDFPISERIASEELSLPMFAELTDDQIRQIAGAVRS